MSAWDERKRTTALEVTWFAIRASDIELPDGSVGQGWHWIDFRTPAVGVIPVRSNGDILLVNHYRFTTQTRDWEIPAGGVEPDEPPERAAERELREETGHATARLERLGHYHPSNGASNQNFILFVAQDVTQNGVIEDTNEIEELRWFPPAAVQGMLARNEIFDGMSVTGLLWYFFQKRADAL